MRSALEASPRGVGQRQDGASLNHPGGLNAGEQTVERTEHEAVFSLDDALVAPAFRIDRTIVAPNHADALLSPTELRQAWQSRVPRLHEARRPRLPG